MIFDINYEFENRGVYLFKTDCGVDYKVTFREGDYKSVGIMLLSEDTFSSEIFTTIETLKFILNRISYSKFIITIDDLGLNLRRRKLNILKRYLTDYDYSVVENPHLPPIGRSSSNTILNITQVYLVKKKEIKQKKYCHNCGSENNDYKFCPSCGTNLQ
jgi:hypothetical protein